MQLQTPWLHISLSGERLSLRKAAFNFPEIEPDIWQICNPILFCQDFEAGNSAMASPVATNSPA
jgi:hypothetical protein